MCGRVEEKMQKYKEIKKRGDKGEELDLREEQIYRDELRQINSDHESNYHDDSDLYDIT